MIIQTFPLEVWMLLLVLAVLTAAAGVYKSRFAGLLGLSIFFSLTASLVLPLVGGYDAAQQAEQYYPNLAIIGSYICDAIIVYDVAMLIYTIYYEALGGKEKQKEKNRIREVKVTTARQ